ncbi:CAP domain-containing protein [Sporocytophaga myxococcoides]|uniref:CAP domain-containing protein n=1 Tax=Sporocytophaga myxococcoides TaxID=153721 RepID=UPI00040B14BA|nr:CAP domain-containing protein [Sporocytophaga myxococcoides]
MRLITFSFLILLLSFRGLFAQTPIDFNNFDDKLLTQKIYLKLNEVRDSLGLSPFVKDSILTAAAINQAKYIKKVDNLVHNQDNPAMATVEQRVESYKGTHEKVAENVDVIYTDRPFTVYKEKEPMKINTYESAAFAFVRSSLNTSSNSVNVLNREFSATGIGIGIIPEKKCIYIAQVFGPMAYNFPSSIKTKDKKIFYPSKKINIENAFGIEPSNEVVCGKCVGDFNKIPDYIENKIIVENGKVYYSFSDLGLFNKTFPETEGEFSFSVDIVLRSQFPCSSGNIVHRSFAFDGIMLVPVTLKELLKSNSKASSNALYAYLGDIPGELKNDEYVCNLIVIKDNHLCTYYVDYPKLPSSRSIISTEVFVDTLLKSEITKKKNLKFTIPFEKDKSVYSENDIRPFYDSLNLNKYNITEVVVLAYSSIEGSTERNQELQKSRAESIIQVLQSFQLNDTIKKVIKAQENWDQFYRDVKNTPFNYLTTLSKEKIKEALQKDSLSKAMEFLLARERKAILFLKIVERIDLTRNKDSLAIHYQNALAKKDVAVATTLQTAIFDAISNKELSADLLTSLNPPKTKEFAQLINNQILFRQELGQKFDYIGELNQTSALDPTNVFIKYNICDLSLKAWAADSAYLQSPEGFMKNIKALYNTKIDKKLVNKLYLNFQILISPYFLTNKKFKYRDDAINLVKKYYKTTELSSDDLLTVAKFFAENGRAAWALEILFPIMQKGEYSEDMLFNFLAISITRPDLFEKKEFESYFLKAKDMNSQRFCSLFGYDKVNFMLFKEEELKVYFCKACNLKQ